MTCTCSARLDCSVSGDGVGGTESALVAQDDEEVGEDAAELEAPATAVERQRGGGGPGPPGLARHHQPRARCHAPTATPLPRIYIETPQ